MSYSWLPTPHHRTYQEELFHVIEANDWPTSGQGGIHQLTDVKGLEKLNQLTYLCLLHNPDLTKAQIDELQKALPKCKITSNPTK